MTRNALTLALLVFSIALSLSTVVAKAAGLRCAMRDVVLANLSGKLSETRRSVGLAGNGILVETFAAKSGSWTIVSTRPDGVSCIVASGRHFETIAADARTGDPA